MSNIVSDTKVQVWAPPGLLRTRFRASVHRDGDRIVLKSRPRLLLFQLVATLAGICLTFLLAWPGWDYFAIVMGVFVLFGGFVVVARWRTDVVRIDGETVELELRSIARVPTSSIPKSEASIYIWSQEDLSVGPQRFWDVLIGRLPDVVSVARFTRERDAVEQAATLSALTGIGEVVNRGAVEASWRGRQQVWS